MQKNTQQNSLESLVDTLIDMKDSEKRAAKIRDIVPIEEWIESTYYVGPDALSIYPYWKQHIINIFNSPVRINEVILTGSLGTGKTTIANIIMLRKIYELSCYENIPALFNLMASSKIMLAYFNLTMSQAEQTGFGQIKQMIDTCPYFQEKFPRDVKNNSLIKFLNTNMSLKFASDNSHIIGSNLIGGFLDEGNFYRGSTLTSDTMQAQNKAASLYADIRNRGKSRFMVDGEDQSFSILVSSAQYDSSFTSQRINENRDDPHTYIVNAKIYDVKPQNYNEERFFVFTGNGELDPMVIDTIADVNSILDSFGLNRVNPNMKIKNAIERLPGIVRDKVLTVPIDFKREFKNNLIKSIQDIAGESVSGQGKLFNNRELYNKAIYKPEEPAFIKDTFTISTKLETCPQDFINPNWQPEQPDKLRFMHVDQGLVNDYYGISCCFIDRIDINEDETVSIHVKFDFICTIIPPKPPAQVDISKVRSLIPWLSKNKGINWGKITYDQFQSRESMQELEKAGFPVEYQSVDRTDEQYLLLVDYIYQERIKFPENKEFEFNIFNVVHYREKRKVDHLSGRV